MGETGPMTVSIEARLARFAGPTFGLRPTPLHHLPRFSAAIGREVWIKRDDLISVGLGGNKVRKLGYLVADARRMGADHLVTVGAEQSNHARCVATVAAMEEMGCDLVLGGDADAPVVGNLLLDHLLGARLHFPGTHDWLKLEEASHRVAAQLRAQGRTPYVMPIGGSTPIGALGFAEAFLELRGQMVEAGVQPSSIVHATSSGGTQAGLVVGALACGGEVPIVGVGVAKTGRTLRDEIVTIAQGTASLLETEAPSAGSITVLDGFVGEAYAVPTPGAIEALRLLFQTEGILVDPVYTAKALHAVVEGPTALGDGPIVFWHTGGWPAVFAPQFGVGRSRLALEVHRG